MARSPMTPLYEKLAAAGFLRRDLKKILPSWWSDDIASTPSGYQSAALRFASMLGLSYASLVGDGDAVSVLGPRCFKRQNGVEEHRVSPASAIAAHACRLTLQAYEKTYHPQVISAQELRENLLARGNQWIDFRVLVSLCWELAIPVVFVQKLPAPKMHGMAISIDGRPVIVLTQNRKYGYLVFDLAHELGHVMSGHVSENAWIVDDEISSDENNEDDKEREATRYGLELLTGKPSTNIRGARMLAAQDLASASLRFGKQEKIDPMHVVLNYGHCMKNMAIANRAINELTRILDIPDTDPEVCRNVILSNIDLDLLDFDEQERLCYLVGANIE